MSLDLVRKLRDRNLLDPVIEEALSLAGSGLDERAESELWAICSDVMFRKAQYTDAVKYGEKSVAADSGNADGYAALGWALYWLGRNDEALRSLERAAELDPHDAEVHYRIGSILHNAFRDLERADAEFTRAVELDPDHVVAWQQRAICRIAMERKEEGEADLRVAAGLGDSYSAYLLDYYGYPMQTPEESLSLAGDMWMQNQGAQATDLMAGVLDSGVLSPERELQVRLLLADRLSAIGLDDRARTQYDSAVESSPDSAEALLRRGWFHYQATGYADAESDLARAAELAPENSLIAARLGALYAALDRPEEGLALLDRAIEADPWSSDLFHSRAVCHHKLGNDDRAKSDFGRSDLLGHRTALADRRRIFDDEVAADFFSSGLERADAGDAAGAALQFEKAAGLFEEEIRYEGDRAWRYTAKSLHNRGHFIYTSGGDTDTAISCIRRALEMEPGYKDAWVTLGNIHDSRGDTGEAVRCYDRSIELQPNDGRGYYSRGRVRMQSGEFDLGVEDFTSAIKLYGRRDWRGDAYYNRARCHEGAGRIELALADYQEAFNHGVQQGIQEAFRIRDQYGIE